jgi:prepilin-type N-terminal cleavage/methylation domain-containing protein
MGTQKGYTLIELLILIAMITIILVVPATIWYGATYVSHHGVKGIVHSVWEGSDHK